MLRRGKGKADFTTTSQTYIDLVDSTANLEHISGIIHRRWGSNYTLVTNDGLELEDSPATQGLAFWKCPRRKLYAVTHRSIMETIHTSASTSHSNYKRPIVLDSDDEEFVPKRKERRDERLNVILNEVTSIKDGLNEMMSLTKESAVPLGLKRILRDTFKCSICHSVPIKPPMIVTKCCKTILACEQCVNEWYSGPDALMKVCPMCRAERGYNDTMLLRGLDDFLVQVKVAIEEECPSENLLQQLH